MQNKVRFGMIGYGKVAALHAKALATIQHGELVSVCGHRQEKRDSFAYRWGLNSRNSVKEMVKEDAIQAVLITTPHPQHYSDALLALKAGCHVLVEKPLTLSVAEAETLISEANKRNLLLSVIAQRRWYPSCQRIRHAIDEGNLGIPALGQLTILGWRDEAYYRSDPWRGSWEHEGGGVIVNQAPHQFDLLCWYMGEVAEVYGRWSNINHPYIEVDDSAVATVLFKSGGLASIFISNSQKPGIYAKVHIHGSSGASAGVQTDGGAMFIAGRSAVLEAPYNDIWTIPGQEALRTEWQKEDEEFFSSIDATWYFFAQQEENFARAILEGQAPSVTGSDGLQVARIIEGIYRSNREGIPIRY
ncbi:MAG TPA: Gfo/Idh/MocA family oxidoreductase [Rectinema sp.]|nr:Gfo/Idh/MocA family oxidoreductase [Rectinema sp.]HQE68904.1 Gfo/Idh/MocA family oxidoreductase [Rectinema sp.]